MKSVRDRVIAARQRRENTDKLEMHFYAAHFRTPPLVPYFHPFTRTCVKCGAEFTSRSPGAKRCEGCRGVSPA